MARMRALAGWCSAAVAAGFVAVSAGAAGERPSGADGAELVWLDLGPVECTGDALVPAGTLDGYHTYRLHVRMHTYDSVNLVSTGSASRHGDMEAAPLFFPETQPFQHPAGSNMPPTGELKAAAASVGVCIDVDSYFVLGAPGAEMFFYNEPSPSDWGAALNMIWLGIPKQFGVIDPTLFGDDAWYGWIMQITVPPGTPINGQLVLGFGDANLGTRGGLVLFDVPPLSGEGASGKSSLGGLRASALDADASGFIDAADVATVLGAWGKCSADCLADVNRDRRVNQSDLAAVLRPLGYTTDLMDKVAWRDAMAAFNADELQLMLPGRDARTTKKHLKLLYKAMKG